MKKYVLVEKDIDVELPIQQVIKKLQGILDRVPYEYWDLVWLNVDAYDTGCTVISAEYYRDATEEELKATATFILGTKSRRIAALEKELKELIEGDMQ